MDQDRQVRFAIPPFFLFSSLLLGAYFGQQDLSPLLKPETSKEFLGLLATGAVLLVPLGFLLSTVSLFIIKFIVTVLALSSPGVGPYEARLSNPAFEEVWRRVNADSQYDVAKALYAVVTFDHELLAPGIHTWIMRRWNSFNVSAHSAVALAFAYVGAYSFDVIPLTWAWTWWTLALVVLFMVAAYYAWRDTMGMIEFQAQRQKLQVLKVE